MRAVLVVLVAGCAQPTTPPVRSPAKARPTPANWRTLVTPLEVIVIDDYRTQVSCDGVAPRRIEVFLDGKPVSAATVPCSTEVRVPPAQRAAPAFEVPPGKHVIRMRDVATGLEAETTLVLPMIEPPFGEADDDDAHLLATKLPVWANDDELDIQGLRASMTSL